MEYFVYSDGSGGWIIDQGRGSPQQNFAAVNFSAAGTAESGSAAFHFLSATLTDNHNGTATLT